MGRHVADLKRQSDTGIVFDPAEGERWIEFAETFCRHTKGDKAGQLVVLEPWQCFEFYVFFGWKQWKPWGKDNKLELCRRFNIWYEEIARKNGKTFKAAAIAIGAGMIDGEGGADVYFAATKRDQARICFDEACAMVRKDTWLRSEIEVYKTAMACLPTRTKWEPLSADEKTLDGLNPYTAVADEVHAHKNRGVWDKLTTGTGARKNPITMGITTAGYDRESLCWDLHTYTKQVLEATIENDSWFGIIYSLDEGDDWRDESKWIKANPNLGVSASLEDLRRKCEVAKRMPAAQNEFRRLHCNEWTESATRWLDGNEWDACGVEFKPEDMQGQPCYIALDLSTKLDLTAAVAAFPLPDNRIRLLPRFWLPEGKLTRKTRRDEVDYRPWIRAGFIETTPGDSIDYEYIRAAVRQWAKQFKVLEVVADPWGATETLQRFADEGLTVAEFRQGYASMSGPTKDFEADVVAKRIEHNRNPVMNWMAANVVVERDPAGNLKPSKSKSTQKIDGIVAGIMAAARARANRVKASVYESRGVVEFAL